MELNDLYYSPNINPVIKSRRMRWAGHVARMGRGEACTGFWRGNLKEKTPLGRLRRRWENNIEMDLQKEGRSSMDWIDLAQKRDRRRAPVNAVMNLRVP